MAFELRSAFVTRKQGGHEEHVSMPLHTSCQLIKIGCQFAVIARIYSSKGLSADIARLLTHYVKLELCVCPGGKQEPAHVAMEFQQLAGSRDGYGEGPSLVDLLD